MLKLACHQVGKSLFARMLGCLSLVLLVACGEPSSNPGTDDPTDPTNPGTTYRLSVTITGQGSVSSVPEGLECSETCSADFTENTPVTLRAKSADGWVFAGWNGEGCGVAETCELVLDAERSVTALFVDEDTPQYSLSIERTGVGQGRVTSSDGKVDCPDDCSGRYYEGFTATLEAQAADTSTFEGWRGAGCSGTENCEVMVTSDLTVIASFGVPNAVPEVVGLSDQDFIQNTEASGTVELPFTISDAEDSVDVLGTSVTTDSPEVLTDLQVSCDGGDCLLSLEVERDEAVTARVNVEVTDTDGGEGGSSLTVTVAPRLVTTTSDSGEGSLRGVLAEAEAGDVVGFDTSGGFGDATTITLADELVLDKNITFTGTGSELLSLSGNETQRLLYVNSGVTARVEALSLINGVGRDGNGSRLSDAIGGAVVNRGDLTLNNVTLENNRAEQGGAVYNVAGATLTLENVTAEANSATRSGGVIFNDQGSVSITNSSFTRNSSARFGGVMYIYKKEPAEGEDPGPDAVVTIANSTFNENSSQSSSVIANGYLGGTEEGCPRIESACVPYAGTLTIEGSSFKNNLSEPTDLVGANGALSNFGTLSITSTTFEGNEAPAGAALYIQFKSTAVLDNVTITDNRALDSTAGGTLTPGNGAGIYNEGALTFQNGTIVSNNEVENSGGGVFNNGFVGTLTVPVGNSITGNTADADDNDTGEGGGVYNEGTASGIDGVAAGTVTGNTPTNFAGDQIEPSLSIPTRPRLTYRDHRP